MTDYEVRYLSKLQNPGGFVVSAVDASDAVRQFQAAYPNLMITSVLPADEWDNRHKPYVVYLSRTQHGHADFHTREEAEAFMEDEGRNYDLVEWYSDDCQEVFTLKVHTK